MDQHAAVTRILDRAAAGDGAAALELLPLVYEQLRAAAQRAMGGERVGHTLTATALVHEAYVRLVGPGGGGRGVGERGFANRGHFYAAAAQAMRQYLVDHARARLAQKRGGPGEDHAGGGGMRPRNLGGSVLREVADLAAVAEPEEILSLDAALSRLEGSDPQAAAVVRLRFFAGLSVEQTAEVLGVSPATVKRDWQFARARLFRELSDGSARP